MVANGGSAGPRLVVAALAALAIEGCGGDEPLIDGFTAAEWARLQTLSPLPAPPADPTNHHADDDAAATLGQRLFFDKRFSGPIVTAVPDGMGGHGAVGDRGTIACATCHDPTAWFTDKAHNPGATAVGTDYMTRNAGSVVNVAFYDWKENDGYRDNGWSDALTDPEDPTSMNASRLLVAHALYDAYRSDYQAVFGAPLDPALDPAAADAARFPAEGQPGDAAFDAMTDADKTIVNTIFANWGKAIHAYDRRLVSRDAPFDRYVAGDTTAIGAAAKRGLGLFIGKAACVQCHSGPAFTDNKFHDIGMAAMGEHVDPTETGRFDAIPAVLADEFNSDSPFSDDRSTGHLKGLMARESDRGRWRTHGLRQVAETGPYTHTGQLASLTDVVALYNRGGDAMDYVGVRDPLIVPLNLSDGDIADLVEFLKTLTGAPVGEALTRDTSAP
jgi:cytochrome c peroxidase